MNNFNIPNINLNSLFIFSGVNLIFKIGFLLADLFAIIFLLVVLKQIFSMDHIVHDSSDFMFIKNIGFLLLFVAISLFLISLVIL
jgi:hypothetical protein